VPLLDRVYEHDAALVQQVEALATAAEQSAGKQDQAAGLVSDLLKQIDEIERQWDLRNDILKGVK